MADKTTAANAAKTEEATTGLDWSAEPAVETPAPAEEPKQDDGPKMHVDRDTYIAGLEVELAMYGKDPEHKASVLAELDRVRGGKAVKPPKETR